ncbi:hypothetical protein [Leptothoe sp. PORK10 BA2]|uniref:hypothetical protein n=1 Tax=Leptothoe sp. PORK10 BA2 TaxID=3110254 RepID=UPI002B2105E0|nr:hypothetical protein [Leptothoe sp. PORK10 BA2]MEA5462994.1 hypothetical protein [Leptothoe sp. PORK10 BA2]
MKASDWLESLPDRLIAARKLVFPKMTDAANALGVSKQALEQRERKRYKGAKIETLITMLKLLEEQAIVNPPSKGGQLLG